MGQLLIKFGSKSMWANLRAKRSPRN